MQHCLIKVKAKMFILSSLAYGDVLLVCDVSEAEKPRSPKNMIIRLQKYFNIIIIIIITIGFI